MKRKQILFTFVILLLLAIFILFLSIPESIRKGKRINSDPRPISSITFPDFFTKKEIIPSGTKAKNETIGKICDIAVDEDENIFILDISDHNIKKFNSQGTHLLTIGRKGQGPGEMFFPNPYTCLRIFKDEVYVIDNGNKKINIFNKNSGTFINSIQINFSKVTDFTVVNDNIFLLDYKISDGKIIYRYDSTGNYISSFGYTGLNESEKQRIIVFSYYCEANIDSDNEGKIYYSPQYFLSNKIFSKKGKLIRIFSRKNSFFRSPDLNNRYYDQKLPFIENMKVVSNKFIFNVIKVRENKNRKILDIYKKQGDLIVSDIIFPDELYELWTWEIDNSGNLYYLTYSEESFEPVILKFLFNPEILSSLISH